MISEKELYDKVSQTLKKQFSGFLSGPDFTRAIKTAELDAFEHFVSYFERTQRVVDALLPFIVTVNKTTSSTGVLTLPTNFRHHIRLSRDLGQGSLKKIDYVATNAVEDVMEDYIDRPNDAMGKYIYTFEDGGIKVYNPAVLNCKLRYIRTPVFGKIVFKAVATTNGTEYQYDATNSRKLEWPEHVMSLLENLILKQFGVETREKIAQDYAALELGEYKSRIQIT